MLLKEEFASNMAYIEPSINAMISAGEGNQAAYTCRRVKVPKFHNKN